MASKSQKSQTNKKRTGTASGNRTSGNARSGSRNSGNGYSESRAQAAAGSRRSERKKREITTDIFLLVILAVCILLFLANFGIGGVVGNAISGFFFGLIGMVEYIFPILLLMACFFATSNKSNAAARIKILFAVLIMFLVCTFLQLVTNSINKVDYADFGIGENFLTCKDSHVGGGLFGGMICKGLVSLFGQVPAYIITVILIIICLVLITGKAFFAGVKQGGKKLGRQVADDFDEYRDDIARKNSAKAETRRREENLIRTKQKARGVALDTTIEEKREESLDIHEIRPDSVFKETSPSETEELNRNYYHYEKAEAEKEDRTERTGSSEQLNLSEKTGTSEKVNPAYSANDFDHYADEQEGSYDSEVEEYEYQPEAEPVTEPAVKRIRKDYLKPGNTYDGTPEEEWQEMPAGAGRNAAHGNAVAAEDGRRLSKAAVTTEEEAATGESSARGLTAGETTARKPAGRNTSAGTFSSEGTAAGETGIGEAPEEEFIETPQRPKRQKRYVYPLQRLLKNGERPDTNSGNDQDLKATERKLDQILSTFGVDAHVVGAEKGPAVTRYELQPRLGVKVSRIVALADDIKLGLAATDIRIEAPIPGKSLIGIEVPNKENSGVALGDLIRSPEFKNHKSRIAFCVGKDISGQNIIGDIAKMPHVLIAGATGSGKSVCINTIIMSILYHATPEEVKLIMIDPKVVELNMYNGIPHLLSPVVTDPKKAAGALQWAVNEMMSRYEVFAKVGCKDMTSYNERVDKADAENPEVGHPAKMPQIVIIIDELADLMMVASKEVEDSIVRLAQLARAAGIHLVIATQRPSVNVITGLIKANVPSRIAFAVTSGVDSRTILDMYGAEKLLGKGDMLYYPQGMSKPIRVQGAFVSEEEVATVVDYIKENNSSVDYDESVGKTISGPAENAGATGSSTDSDSDEFLVKAGYAIIEKQRASIGLLQRLFKIGFNRAARIMDELGEIGLVGPEEGTKPRKILMTKDDFDKYLRNQ